MVPVPEAPAGVGGWYRRPHHQGVFHVFCVGLGVFHVIVKHGVFLLVCMYVCMYACVSSPGVRELISYFVLHTWVHQHTYEVCTYEIKTKPRPAG